MRVPRCIMGLIEPMHRNEPWLVFLLNKMAVTLQMFTLWYFLKWKDLCFKFVTEYHWFNHKLLKSICFNGQVQLVSRQLSEPVMTHFANKYASSAWNNLAKQIFLFQLVHWWNNKNGLVNFSFSSGQSCQTEFRRSHVNLPWYPSFWEGVSDLPMAKLDRII